MSQEGAIREILNNRDNWLRHKDTYGDITLETWDLDIDKVIPQICALFEPKSEERT